MSPLQHAVWEWLPGRRDRQRHASPHACAATLGVPLNDIITVLLDLEAHGHAIRDGHAKPTWHRGTPLTTHREDPTLW